MKAEIITIGDEILAGQVIDTNATFIAGQLNKTGISVIQITSIQDNKQHIVNALSEAATRADLILTTGGLGPTKDDITKNAFCEYFNDTLVQNDIVLQHITNLFKTITNKPLNSLNKQQALVPSKAIVLHNENGTAPGIWMEENNKTYIVLPGVPYEMKALVKNEVLPKLTSKFQLPYIINKTIVTQGESESVLAERIAFWEDALPKHIKLSYLPNLGMVKLRLSAKGINKQKVTQEITEQIEKILPHLKEIHIGFENTSLETEIAQLLTTKNQTLSVSESCTGGLITSSITKNKGASSFFKGGIITCQIQTKVMLLGVSDKTINKHTVVSEQVALEMVEQTKRMFQSDYAISVTGNTDLTKGGSDTEVGTVYIAIATPEKMSVKKFNFGKNRYKVQNKAKNNALELLKKAILE